MLAAVERRARGRPRRGCAVDPVTMARRRPTRTSGATSGSSSSAASASAALRGPAELGPRPPPRRPRHRPRPRARVRHGRPPVDAARDRDRGAARSAGVGRFLDLGCGSGILTMRRALLWPGARGLAVDLDPEAVATARENLERNHITSVEARVGSLAAAGRRRSTSVLANIQATCWSRWRPRCRRAWRRARRRPVGLARQRRRPGEAATGRRVPAGGAPRRGRVGGVVAAPRAAPHDRGAACSCRRRG